MQNNHRNNADITYSGQRKIIRNNHRKFSQQEVTFDDAPLYFPAGLEKLFLFIYFISLPYLAGLAFLFFYVGEGDTSLFSSLSADATYMLTWIIGYEILAVIALLWILKKAIAFTIETSSSQTQTKHFTKP